MPLLVTKNPSGAFLHIRYKHVRLCNRLPALAVGRPALMGGVSINDGLTVPDVAVRVGGPVTLCVRLEEVIVQRVSVKCMVYLEESQREKRQHICKSQSSTGFISHVKYIREEANSSSFKQ